MGVAAWLSVAYNGGSELMIVGLFGNGWNVDSVIFLKLSGVAPFLYLID